MRCVNLQGTYIEFILKNLKYERYEQSHFTFNIQYFNNNQYGTKKDQTDSRTRPIRNIRS